MPRTGRRVASRAVIDMLLIDIMETAREIEMWIETQASLALRSILGRSLSFSAILRIVREQDRCGTRSAAPASRDGRS